MIGIQLKDFDIDIKTKRGIDGKIAVGMVVGDALRQNQAVILTMHKGELKERPAVGCGISDMLLDYDPAAWRHEIREQMEMDGQRVNSVTITTKEIKIDAEYR
ncbi:MAG: hypothetical protein J6W24_05990 [Prevotella sp.]|nr:hypothetical protein [Prevotella sp.]